MDVPINLIDGAFINIFYTPPAYKLYRKTPYISKNDIEINISLFLYKLNNQFYHRNFRTIFISGTTVNFLHERQESIISKLKHGGPMTRLDDNKITSL